jgi:hypothetical protein
LPLAAALFLTSWRAVETRNAAWTDETEHYGQLRRALEEWPAPPRGSRLVIYYGGDWADFWATAVARGIYGDPTLQLVTIPGRSIDKPFASQANDQVFYMLNERLLPGTARR